MVTAFDFPAGSVIPNKYLNWYLSVCAISHVEEYTEKHHIVPKSFGGSNAKANCVRLSARAHYIAHVLLIRCAIGTYRRSAALAAHYMMSGCQNHRRQKIGSSRSYEFVRKEFAAAQRNRIVKTSTRQKIGAAHRGKKLSIETKQKMGLTLRNKRQFYMLQNDVYSGEQDFYRYCDTHQIGRSQVQAGLRTCDIHVTRAGKHKGTCFSWHDVGITAMQHARATALAETRFTRQQATTRQWKIKSKVFVADH